MRTAKIVLDGKEFAIRELRHRPNREWRKQLEGELNKFSDALAGGAEIEVTDLRAISSLVRAITGLLTTSVDTMCTLIVAYEPALQEAVENGYDSEIATAFLEVLKLAYPFGNVVDTLRRIGSESRATQRS